MKQKIVALIVAIAGVIMLVSGAIAWGVTSSQLSAENITVPGDSQFMGGAFAGKQVTGPLSAFAQAATIQQHVEAMTQGQTFAELGQAIREAGEGTEAATQLQELRNTVQEAAFLRASLFTSVLAFGVSALVMGVGVLFGLIGWGMLPKKQAKVVEEKVAEEAA